MTTYFEATPRESNPSFFPAKWGGRCPVCGERYDELETIGYPKGYNKPGHKSCVLEVEPPPEPPSAAEKSGKLLTFERGWFKWLGDKSTKDIPKAAGFLWGGGEYARSKGCPFEWAWATKFKDAAYKLLEYADSKALAQLQEYVGEIEASQAVDLSGAAEDATGFTCPAGPGMTYREAQLAGIHYALRRDQTLIADEQGVGKTAEALGVTNCMGAKQVVMIGPTAVTLNWQREAEAWLADADDWVIWRNTKPSEVPPKAEKLFAVVGYGAISAPSGKALRKALQAHQWDLVIIDEAHFIKNPKSVRGRALLGKYDRDEKLREWGVVERGKKVVYLTGTPIPNRPLDIFPILNRMFREFRGSNAWQHFATRYNMSFQGRYGWVHPTARAVQAGEYAHKGITWELWQERLRELNERLRALGMIRRLKEQVLDMPPLQRQIIPIPEEQLGTGGKAVIKASVKLFPEIAAGTSVDPTAYNAVMQAIEGHGAEFDVMSKLREQAGLAKVPAAAKHIRDLLEEHEQLVVFTWHHSVREQLIEVLTKGKDPVLKSNEYVQHHGKLSDKVKNEAIDAFNAGFPVRVMFGQIQSAGVGINLHKAGAHNVVFVEISWRADDMSQAEARVHRGDQKNKVLSQTLVIDNSFDAYVAQSMSAKMEVAHEALDSNVERPVSFEALKVETEKAEEAAREAVKIDREKYEQQRTEWEAGREDRKRTREEKKKANTAKRRTKQAYRTRRIEDDAAAARLTPEQIDLVGEVVTELAAMDPDFAMRRNDVGYSKADVALGHSLAWLYNAGQMTSKEAYLGAYVAFKYARQIGTERANALRAIVGVQPIDIEEPKSVSVAEPSYEDEIAQLEAEIYARLEAEWEDALMQRLAAETKPKPVSIVREGTCAECGDWSSSLRECVDSSGISGLCCPRCAALPRYERSFA